MLFAISLNFSTFVYGSGMDIAYHIRKASFPSFFLFEVTIRTLPYFTRYRPAMPSGNRKVYFRGSFQFITVAI